MLLYPSLNRRLVSTCLVVLTLILPTAPLAISQENEAFDEDAFEDSEELATYELEQSFIETMGNLQEGKYSQVARELKSLATKGHAKSQHVLGVFYRNGFGLRKNIKRSNYWFELSSEQEYPLAMLAYAEACLSGDAVKKNSAKAAELLEKVSAKNWDFGIPVDDYTMARNARSRAAYLLGIMFSEGDGVEKNYPKAIELMHQAAGTGELMATMYLAIEYARGEKVERNVAESKRFFELVDLQAFDMVRRTFQSVLVEGIDAAFREDLEEVTDEMSEAFTRVIFESQLELAKDAMVEGSDDYDAGLAISLLSIAAESGYKEAQFLLGHSLAVGFEEEPDFEKARYWLSKATEQGWTLADYNFGIMLLQGLGGLKDEKRARSLIDEAAQYGLYQAQLVLDGDAEPVFITNEKDVELARSARKDDVRAAYSLTKRETTGWGVDREKNTKKLIREFKAQTKAGYARSEYRYGMYYYRGRHVDRDYELALKSFTNAAAKGVSEAYFYLGYMYDNSYGMMAADYEKAAYWYEKAMEQGDSAASNNLGNIYTDGTLGERNYEKAMECYHTSVENGSEVACYNIAQAYRYGRGVEENLTEAIVWYEKAADLGDLSAVEKLVALYRENMVEGGDVGDLAYWVEKAADLGDRDSMKEMAERYYRGLGVPKSPMKAFSWIVQFLNTETRWIDYSARMLLADIYLEDGWMGHNPEGAYDVVKYLIKQEYIEARFRYAEIHRKNLVKKSNPIFAFKEYRKLYKEGLKEGWNKGRVAQAAFLLSRMYAKGEGVKQSDQKRAEWMKAAADHGLVKAKYLYAGYEIAGMGVEVNFESGLSELEELGDRGYRPAILKMARLAVDGLIELEGRDQLIENLKALGEAGNVKAKELLRDLGFEVEEELPAEELEEEEPTRYRGPAAIS